MALVVAIANQKGGVGKTTTAVNLSASLAVAEQRVLIIDADPQGNASSGLGCDPGSDGKELYSALLGEATLEETISQTELPRLQVVASSRDLAGAEIELIDEGDRALRLRRALQPVRRQYDYVFIDCPPSLGILTINALVAADTVLVPMQAEYYSLEGLGSLMNTIGRVRGTLNPTLRLDGVLLTMFDPRNNLANQVAVEVSKHFRVYDTVIPRNVRLAEAPSYGKPIVLYDPSSKGAHGYLNLASEILDRHVTVVNDDRDGRSE
jgi:chromosome partitioning protein